jgi:NAD(P)H-dependent FMN reductase
MSKKILVFGASASPNSINLQFAKYASSFLAPHEVTVIDFANFVPETIYVQGREKGTVPK